MTTRSARNTAMDLMSRREHSRRQLQEKLRQKGFESDAVNEALDQLQAENLLSDERFAETYLHQRMQRGFGPLRIRQELKEKGVDAATVQILMEACEQDWQQLMQQQRIKRFGMEIPQDYREMTKQARFLQNRGFSPDAVMRLFRR